MTNSQKLRTVVGTAAIASALLTPTVAQAANLPVGSHAGVSIKATAKRATFTFGSAAAKAYREIAGHKVDVDCAKLQPTPLGATVDTAKGTTVDVPKRGHTLRAEVAARRSDFCTITSKDVVHRGKNGRLTSVDAGGPLVRVPLTQRGAVWVDEFEVSEPLATVSGVAVRYALTHHNRYPSAAVVKATITKAFPTFALIPLANPAASPPLGSVGYYSDGATALTVAVAHTGRRLYIETAPDSRLTSNVTNYLFAQ